MGAGPHRVDARCAVLCAWIFDLEGGAVPPFGFDLLDVFDARGTGYLGALLRCGGPDEATYLVGRGTRVDTRSAGALFRGLREDLGTAAALLAAFHSVPALTAATEAALAAQRGADAAVPLRLTGQSLGGGLAQLGSAACLEARRTRPGLADIRCVTFGAMDVSRSLTARFAPDVVAALATRAVNHVSDRDGLTGPGGIFGASRIGEQRVFRDMDGPRLGGGLAFHRARAWVNHCAGRPADAPEPRVPADPRDWSALTVRGSLPDGWPRRPPDVR